MLLACRLTMLAKSQLTMLTLLGLSLQELA